MSTPETDSQAQPLPADPSENEYLVGSVDRKRVTATPITPTDMQKYKDYVESEDDIEITHVTPRKTSKPTTTGQQVSILTADGQVLEGRLTPAYMAHRTPGGSRIATAPTGFQTIQGVQRVRPEATPPLLKQRTFH